MGVEESMISIGTAVIGANHPPFIVAEMSANHNQSLDRALAIVYAAARAGAHAVKLQTYLPSTLTADTEVYIDNPKIPWHQESLYELYRQAYMPWEWHAPIFKRCAELGLIAFSTPFDETAVDFLEALNVPAYKIASFEINHLPLIRKVAATGKPLMLSTGVATLGELEEAVQAAQYEGCRDIILLKCTSQYPAHPREANLLALSHLRRLFGCEVGLSDHTMGIGVAVAGVALGATVVEKHLTIRRSDGGVDSSFSMEPHELHDLVIESERAWQATGQVSYAPSEMNAFKRALYIVKDMKAGDVLTAGNLKILRPGKGLAPKYMDTVLGKRICKDAPRGTPLSWDLLLQGI